MTVDHKVSNEEGESRNIHRYAVVTRDLATQWVQSCPCKTKTSQETDKNLRKFFSSRHTEKVIYINNALEFGKFCEELSWNHRTSTPHRFETNAIGERAVRRGKEGTSAVLSQSGSDENGGLIQWSAIAICEMFKTSFRMRNTSYERRFGEPFKGPIIPVGAVVRYHLVPIRDQSRLHQFGKNVLSPIFLGCALIAVRIWTGYTLIADFEELEKFDASEVYPRRSNAKEVLRYPDSGFRNFGKVGCISNLSTKIQCERIIDITKREKNSYSQ